jgi:amphi-Trp domain-containing protein
MPEMKFKKTQSLSREEAAARLTEIAQALSQGEEFELERGGEKLKLDVPEEVTLEFEVEIEDGKTELEVEIKWPSQVASSASSQPGQTD